MPDVLAFSVLGWNVRQFGALAETFKQVNPKGTVIFGGNHVSNQAERTLRQWPVVDVIVNGEGELTFVDLLSHIADGRTDLADVAGISYRDADGSVRTTAERARIEDLDIISSPILNGVLPLHNDTGAFRYDVALLETNRGCPYHCSFCYWGGAVGQRVRSFSRGRLRAELEALARSGAETVVLCDANFGILRADLEFVEDLVEVRRRYGYPRALESSWAKNKSKTFYEIVDIMRREGIRSSFTLALQTLSDDALATMNRTNMKINAWKDLTERLSADGMDIYAELIWGAPGETPESFLKGYDELARHVSRIAAYPLILLPNTDYVERKDLYGFVTIRGDRDDFEYVLANKDMTLRQNLSMQRFLFWARLLAENLVLRHVFPALRAVGGRRQSEVILSIADHVEGRQGAGAQLRAGCCSPVRPARPPSPREGRRPPGRPASHHHGRFACPRRRLRGHRRLPRLDRDPSRRPRGRRRRAVLGRLRAGGLGPRERGGGPAGRAPPRPPGPRTGLRARHGLDDRLRPAPAAGRSQAAVGDRLLPRRDRRGPLPQLRLLPPGPPDRRSFGRDELGLVRDGRGHHHRSVQRGLAGGPDGQRSGLLAVRGLRRGGPDHRLAGHVGR
ncbi:hypothetical protein GCM10011574_44800 [Microbispora bryophytorum]|uniref:Radical SAM protein n=1 Tax=Microbispora bryophytorum TaxID=1460882 RepID=A0A8H9H179_9ACTN|nr:hypothetical protein GCM10011574_44800 [Microbispora bryophytorum]